MSDTTTTSPVLYWAFARSGRKFSLFPVSRVNGRLTHGATVASFLTSRAAEIACGSRNVALAQTRVLSEDFPTASAR